MKRVKVYQERQALLDRMADKSENFASLYNMGLIQVTFFVVMVLIVRVLYNGALQYVNNEITVFGGLRDWILWLGLEILQLTVALLIYPAFMVWRQLRRLGVFIDFMFAAMYLGLFPVTMVMVWKAVHVLELAPVPRVVGTLEHMRLVMKTYSFIRENAAKVLYPWNKDDEEGPALWYKGQMEPSVGSFGKYLYFLIAPVFLYRDRYPRMKGGISWWNVGAYLFQFVVFAHTSRILFAWVAPVSLRPEDLLSSLIASFLLSEVVVLLSLLTIFHAWQNLTSELTLFADRESYEDWWNSESYTMYYRKWNVPIYDWLFAYVYQDLKPVIKSRVVRAILIFFISSLMHDYQLAVAMGYYLPIILMFFTGIGGGIFLTCPRKTGRVARILTLFGLFVGVALILFVCVTECTARIYCPNTSHFYVTVHCLTLEHT